MRILSKPNARRQTAVEGRKASSAFTRFPTVAVFAAVVYFSALSPYAIAQDKWRFSEFFSSADGSVQFIEMTCLAFNDENDIATGEIRSLTTGKVFVIPADLPSTATSGKTFLIATDNFESLPGAVLPDYATFSGLPANFFDPNGDAISFFHVPHGLVTTRSFFSVPTDGVNSMQYPLNSAAVNTPTNFAGQIGSINLNVAQLIGDYNGNGVVDAADYVVWRDNLGMAKTIPNDKSPGTVSTEDYDVWRQNFGRSAAGGTSTAAVPEPSAVACYMLAALIFAAECARRPRLLHYGRCSSYENPS